MKTKRKAFKPLLYLGMLSVAFTVFLCPATSITAHAATSGTEIAMPCSDNIGYVFFSIGKKLYKQLYNFTKEVWIGDPIYVGELP